MKRSAVYLVIATVLVIIVLIFIGIPTTRIVVETLTPMPSATRILTATPSATSTPTFTETPLPTVTPTSTETATEPPTATVEPPTNTATSTEVIRVLIRVVADVAVFRSGPGRVYPTVAQAKLNTKIELSGISADHEWYMFIYDDQNTWISADALVTEVIQGDINTLPVIDAPPVPSPRPTSVNSDGGYNIGTCDFYNNMDPDTQNTKLEQVYNAVNANDWHQAGLLARHLYNCPAQATFYLLYDVYIPSHPGIAVADAQTAFTLFQQGWLGK